MARAPSRLETHLRLAGHEPGETVFSEQFEEHLRFSTLGYVNAVRRARHRSLPRGHPNAKPTHHTDIIDAVRLNERVARGREPPTRRLARSTVRWSTDATPAP